MAKFVKIMLLLLSVWLLNSVADNFSADESVSESTCALTYPTADSQEYDNPQLPYMPDGELTTAQSHQVVTPRFQRYNLLEYSSTLKSLLQNQLSREAALMQHLGKIYNTTTAYNSHPSSEYYVFALRRIII